MNTSSEITYFIILLLLLIFPIVTAVRRYWIAAGIFIIGCVLFLYEIMRDKGGWDDLANFATFIVVVIPIYVIGAIVWAWSSYRRRKLTGNHK